ncbi:MAG TPA: alpha/beta hydrolase [Gemmatimonadota bacterium]|nr:alpha/beta hydrolase [Gemmatimonadota bacterium]
MSLSATQEPWPPSEPVWIDVAGGSLPVWTAGAGPPVLLLHGISADHTEWDAVARGLARDHRVLVPDLLGRGASVVDASAGFSLADEVDRLAALLAASGARRPLVAGHSHGASLGLALAGRVELAGLVLASPVTPWTKRPRVLDLLRFPVVRRAVEPALRTCRRPLTRYILTRRVYGEHRPHVGQAVQRYAEPYADPSRARALLRMFRDWRPDELARLERPAGLRVAVVTGAADRRIVPADAVRWAERLGASCTVLPGAGHGVTEEEPARVEAVLRHVEQTTP